MSKKILSILLVACMVFSMLPMTLFVSAADDNALPAVAFSTRATVTEIGTADELVALMNDSSKWAGNYKLTADIDLSGMTQSPIGNASVAFTGTFDGAGHKISNINISGAGGVGLFGVVSGATVKNVTVSGTVTSSANYVGGLIGQAKNGLTVENCVNNCDVTGTGSANSVGGILGSYPTAAGSVSITKCRNNGTVTAAAYYIGGSLGKFS